jgi:hypothetical protein
MATELATNTRTQGGQGPGRGPADEGGRRLAQYSSRTCDDSPCSQSRRPPSAALTGWASLDHPPGRVVGFPHQRRGRLPSRNGAVTAVAIELGRTMSTVPTDMGSRKRPAPGSRSSRWEEWFPSYASPKPSTVRSSIRRSFACNTPITSPKRCRSGSLQGGGLDPLLQTLADLLHTPVALVGQHRRPLAAAGVPLDTVGDVVIPLPAAIPTWCRALRVCRARE